jgi:hypothetical protein
MLDVVAPLIGALVGVSIASTVFGCLGWLP